jgi:hypothetical protein
MSYSGRNPCGLLTMCNPIELGLLSANKPLGFRRFLKLRIHLL